MSDELLPCPFCGGEAKLLHYTQSPAREFYYLACNGCGVNSPPSGINDNAPDGVIAWWNRRTPTMPANVRDTIRICASYGIPLGITYAEYNAARDVALAWIDAMEVTK